jgi:hypothetical protein
MSKCISSKKLTETLSISECNDGFWLYDKTRGQNISMRTKAEQDCFVEAISYYQKQLIESQNRYNVLKHKVDNFLSSLGVEDVD